MGSKHSKRLVPELTTACINNDVLYLKPYLAATLTDKQGEGSVMPFFSFDFQLPCCCKELMHGTLQSAFYFTSTFYLAK